MHISPFMLSYAESIFQQVHVIFKFAFGQQGAAKAGNRHIGYGEQLVELDIEFFGKKGFIVPLQTVLGRRQVRPGGVVHQG